MAVSLPRGMRDLPPSEAISVKEIIGVCEEIFKRFGFVPLETPAVENLEVLTAKAYGDEPSKQLFTLEGEDAALRYDLTVPLARYVAMDKSLQLPFKRYQIAYTWRKEEPQRMRYREFLQADVDIIGSKELGSDAEVIAAPAMILDRLGLKDYVILLNSRIIVEAILETFGIPKDKEKDAIRALDKISKLSGSEVIETLKGLGLEDKACEELLSFVSQDVRVEGFDTLAEKLGSAKDEIKKMSGLVDAIESYGISGRVKVDLSLARGLDYYTGFVCEFVFERDGKRLPSVCGGGRYDDLIGIFSKKSIPATGMSLGVSRLLDLFELNKAARTYAKVFVAYITEDDADFARKTANRIRNSGIYTDLNVIDRNISKQLDYASALGIKYVVIIGKKEREQGVVRLRNMVNGEEESISITEAIEKIKK